MNNIRKILFFADGAKGCIAAVRRAYGLAKHHGAELAVMGVVADVSTDDRRHRASAKKIQDTLIRDCGLELDSLIASLTKTRDRQVQVSKVVGTGKDYVEIISKSMRDDYDLIVKSANPHTAIHDAVFGSTDLRLMHYSPKPVLILKPLRRKRWRSVLVAVDPIADSPEALQLNSNLLGTGYLFSNAEEAELHAVHVLEKLPKTSQGNLKKEYQAMEKSFKEDAEARLAKLVDEGAAVSVQEHMLKGTPHKAIADFVEQRDIDLLVMGSVARSGIPGLLVGNTAEKILNHVDCSVLVMKPEGFRID